ncbi:Hypothetical_protein [Hexamita inflata]|uniref:Hypothetical_protein n=1 Tax=Hexamita inflata TaxID=28002 RepID=A0AA86PPG3_9EUKA|nr:Hypothetical protein HINF_LOCUS31580 [Hexamita inflata]
MRWQLCRISQNDEVVKIVVYVQNDFLNISFSNKESFLFEIRCRSIISGPAIEMHKKSTQLDICKNKLNIDESPKQQPTLKNFERSRQIRSARPFLVINYCLTSVYLVKGQHFENWSYILQLKQEPQRASLYQYTYIKMLQDSTQIETARLLLFLIILKTLTFTNLLYQLNVGFWHVPKNEEI